MAKQVINIGQTANDRRGDPLRTAFNKVNENFNEVYAALTEGVNFSQVNADWNATTGVAQILNKPTIPSIAGLATETYVNNAVDAIVIPDVSNFITAEDIPAIPADVSDLTDTQGLLGQSDPLDRIQYSSGEGESLVEHDAILGAQEGDDFDFRIRLNTQNSQENQTVWGFNSNGKMTLPNGAELWEDALIGAADQDFYLASKYTPQITRPADTGVGSTFISNIEFDDDIIAVQVGWLVNVKPGWTVNVGGNEVATVSGTTGVLFDGNNDPYIQISLNVDLSGSVPGTFTFTQPNVGGSLYFNGSSYLNFGASNDWAMDV